MATAFEADDWAASYRTRLEPRVITVEPPIEQVTRWFPPRLVVEDPRAEDGKVIVRWSIGPSSEHKDDEWEATPEGRRLFRADRFTRLVLERLAPPLKPRGKSEWEAVAEFEATEGASKFEYPDRKILPRHSYGYRVAGALLHGPARERSAAVEAQTRDIWKFALKFIVVDPRTKTPTAVLQISKYEADAARWFTKECRVWPMDRFCVGGEPVEVEDVVRWNFDAEFGKGKSRVTVNFKTGYTLKSIDAASNQVILLDEQGRELILRR